MGRYALACLMIIFLLSGCTRGPKEEVVSRYPGGSKLETGVFVGEKSNRSRLKSFEYYESGERKKEFAHKDNHFFGPWTFWYRSGAVFAKGEITVKTMTQENAIGSGTYYWPSGGKMVEMGTSADKQSTVVNSLYDEKGNRYSLQTAPADLAKRIKELLDQWHAGKV